MNYTLPAIEVIDRYTIAQIKFQKTNGENSEELSWYQKQIETFPMDLIKNDVEQLTQTHIQIWNLESELKSGKEHLLPLEELGRRAIQIRDWNSQRIQIKNAIADKLAVDNVREIKKDHLADSSNKTVFTGFFLMT